MGKTPIFATLCVAIALTRGGQKFFYFGWNTIAKIRAFEILQKTLFKVICQVNICFMRSVMITAPLPVLSSSHKLQFSHAITIRMK
jgi:hypothetical protein